MSPEAQETFEGKVKVEIGPLGDYSQLVGIEDAIGQLGASEISVERFSEGRATLSMRLDEPVELLRELEEHSPLEFNVRRAADDNLVLDVDEDQDPARRLAIPFPAVRLESRLPGAVAQLEERRAGSAKVRGSSPLSSTLKSAAASAADD